jgi:hypothetical protein
MAQPVIMPVADNPDDGERAIRALASRLIPP